MTDRKTHRRGLPVEVALLKYLRNRDGLNNTEIAARSGLSLSLVEKIFYGKKPQKKSISALARCFNVDDKALQTGFITPVHAGARVLKAYRIVAKGFMPGGDFEDVSRNEDIFDFLSKRTELQGLELEKRELQQLFVLLNQRFIIMHSDGVYRRIDVDFSNLAIYVDIIRDITRAVLNDVNSVLNFTTEQFQHSSLLITQTNERSTKLELQMNLMSMFTLSHPHIHGLSIECWEILLPVFERVNWSSGRQRKNLDLLLGYINNFSDLFDARARHHDKWFGTAVAYFKTLRRIINRAII